MLSCGSSAAAVSCSDNAVRVRTLSLQATGCCRHAPPSPAPTAQEKLADLQHPDAEHLLLGINLEGLREASVCW